MTQAKMQERRGARVSYIPPCEPSISGTALLLSMAGCWSTLFPEVNKERAKRRVGCGGPLMHMVLQRVTSSSEERYGRVLGGWKIVLGAEHDNAKGFFPYVRYNWDTVPLMNLSQA